MHSVSEVRRALSGEEAVVGNKKRKGLANEKKLIPQEEIMLGRFCCLNYGLLMYSQIGALHVLELTEDEEELRQYGYVRRDASKALSRLNIKFAFE